MVITDDKTNKTKSKLSKKKKVLLFILLLAALILMAGIFVGPMNLKITKCKGDEKGLCLAPARYYPIPRVDWNKPKQVQDEVQK